LYANAEIVQHVFAKIFHPCKKNPRCALIPARERALRRGEIESWRARDVINTEK
jgi:hypothetical protein